MGFTVVQYVHNLWYLSAIVKVKVSCRAQGSVWEYSDQHASFIPLAQQVPVDPRTDRESGRNKFNQYHRLIAFELLL